MKMMNIRPSQLGLFLALLSVSTPVASQQVCLFSDDVPDDCPDDTYCSFGGLCLEVGACTDVEDCLLPDNSPYPMALCIGTTVCSDGFCGINCGEFPPENTPIDGRETECATNADCGERGDSYCASDGICEPMGGCAIPDDCFNEANIGFPIAPCMGGMGCNERKCEMDCTGGSDAIFTCKKSKDCPEKDLYCTTMGHCRKQGTCDVVDDCNVFDNSYVMVECIGRQYCDGFQCGIACGEEPVEANPPVRCDTSNDCNADDYCAGNGMCLPAGSCDRVDDCNNLENSFMTIACVGEMSCESGRCAKTCEGTEEEPSCSTSDECGFDEYCAGNGSCLKTGGCDQVSDCSISDNIFPVAACLGTLSCDSGMCSMNCDSSPVDSEKFENGAPVVVETLCSSDSDCLTVATERSLNNLYCAQGVCMEQGLCTSDSDCLNPANVLWNDKKCYGYLHCAKDGYCDRVCGVDCKNGSRSPQCVTNPCDVQPMCEGAVSCQMTTCDNGCGTMFFDAAGAVVDCNAVETGTEADPETPAFAEPATNNLEDGSSAAILRSTVSALFVAVLVAAAV